MKKSKFSESQIVKVLKAVEAGVLLEELVMVVKCACAAYLTRITKIVDCQG